MSDELMFQRTKMLFGQDKMERIANVRIIIFGLGGVGSWCAESLVRSGVKNLSIVDCDDICVTNINRQLQATVKTVGMKKADALKERLLEINPQAQILTIHKVYTQDTAPEFELAAYDCIIDAIDSLSSKIDLIRQATRTNAFFVSSMGAALKVDPTRVKVAEFWKVIGCPFAALIRKKIRKGLLPAREFLCVYGDEVLPNIHDEYSAILDSEPDETTPNERGIAPQKLKKAVINGSMAHMTGIFGFTIAGLILKHIHDNTL